MFESSEREREIRGLGQDSLVPTVVPLKKINAVYTK